MEATVETKEDMMKEIETICSFENRGPTKDGERKAAEYLSGRMREIGLDVNVEKFKVSPHYYWVYFVHVIIVLLCGIATIWTRPLWYPILCAAIVALVIISFWGDLTTRFHLIRNIIPRFPSQNVTGRIPHKEAKKHIIVSAHYDAAKVGSHVFDPELDEKVAKFYKEKFDSTPNVMMPIIITMYGILIVAIVRAIFPSGTLMWSITWAIQGICSLGLLVAAFAFFDIGTGVYVKGANDNLSGVAAMLSIASKIRKEPLKNSELTFLTVGCEEAIMMGMVEFMKTHRELDKENTYFINLETIGNGIVRYATSEGFVRIKPYSEELLRIAKRLVESGEFPEIGTYEVRLGTDGMVPLVRGYKALTIIATNENNFVPHYHTLQDLPENMDIRVTERARDFALRIIRELDSS